MAPQFPSIESFFQPKTSSPPVLSPSSPRTKPGDGFTDAEIGAVLNPQIDHSWTPDHEYTEFNIAALEPGPRCVAIHGRIVNLYDRMTPNKRPKAAKGCVKLILKDDTGAVTVRLWYANMEYNLRLGQLISVWTPHISNGEQNSLAVSQAPLFTSIFPERDRSCHFMLHDNSDQRLQFKSPLGYREDEPLPDLMTLKSFIDGGYDLSDARVLVCVKGVGARKKITDKKGNINELVNVTLFDDTAEASLSLWGSMATSATPWKASQTVLLLSRPGWRIDRKSWLSLTSNTMIDVDPDIPDTYWLRNFAQRMVRKEHVNPSFPDGLFDFRSYLESPQQVLYSLADVDDYARTNPLDKCMGYLSVIIMELNIMKLHRRNMLLCNECCGIPLFSNATKAECKHCEKSLTLGVNPRLIGSIIDETGCVGTGKLLLSPKAWEQLLGRTPEELVALSVETLKYLEQRLLFLRVTLLFGWAAEEGDGSVGRLCIWEVKM